MVEKILIVAPHPDDETIGVGGTLLRAAAEGAELHWLIMTNVEGCSEYSDDFIEQRRQQIDRVAKLYSFASVTQLKFFAAHLDTIPLSEIVQSVSKVMHEIKPTTVYVPFGHDVHSDHQVTSQVLQSCTKTFRYPFINQILAYETLSETEYASPTGPIFYPNVFVDVSSYMTQKLEIMQCYDSELGLHPFPRSLETISSLAMYRGAQAMMQYAESFLLLKQTCR